MSDNEEPPRTPPEDSAAAPVRIKRRSRLRGVLLAVVLIGLLLAGVLWASRPHWRTYISPVNKASGLRLAVQMPENWTLDNREVAPASDTTLTFHEKPTTGFNLWIDKIIWHRDSNHDRVQFGLSPRQDIIKDAATLEQTIRQTQAMMMIHSSTQMSLQHVRYSVGSGLEISVTQRTGYASGTPILQGSYGIILFPNGSPAQRKDVVILTYDGDAGHFGPSRFAFEEAARRMRLLAP